MELRFKPNSNSTGHDLLPPFVLQVQTEIGQPWEGWGIACFTYIITAHLWGPTPLAGGLQKQQKQSTLGAEQRVPSFCLAWMGNQRRPQEVVARRKRGTPGLGMEGAKASRLAHQASAMWLQGLAWVGLA